MRLTQFWDKPSPPGEICQLMDSWQADTRFSYEKFTHESARSFIATHLDAEVVAAYDKCRIAAMQADLFRYCALYGIGGAYIDADVANRGTAYDFLTAQRDSRGRLARLNPFSRAAIRGVLMYRPARTDMIETRNIANDVLVARAPKSPLFEAAIGRACANIRDEVSQNVWTVTGPGVFKALFKDEATHGLFDDYNMVSVRKMKDHVEFHWEMDYKSTDDHWRPTVQSKTGLSIFNAVAKDGGQG